MAQCLCFSFLKHFFHTRRKLTGGSASSAHGIPVHCATGMSKSRANELRHYTGTPRAPILFSSRSPTALLLKSPGCYAVLRVTSTCFTLALATAIQAGSSLLSRSPLYLVRSTSHSTLSSRAESRVVCLQGENSSMSCGTSTMRSSCLRSWLASSASCRMISEMHSTSHCGMLSQLLVTSTSSLRASHRSHWMSRMFQDRFGEPPASLQNPCPK